MIIRKKSANKKVSLTVWTDGKRNVVQGDLHRKPGNPGRTKSLFRVVAEKIPFEALEKVAADLKYRVVGVSGV
ncbi:MAG: hypothetical protein WBP56_16560 [Polyangia bacterium]|jgi:hypothetical protein